MRSSQSLLDPTSIHHWNTLHGNRQQHVKGLRLAEKDNFCDDVMEKNSNVRKQKFILNQLFERDMKRFFFLILSISMKT
jgi:hypothetical protein